MCAGCAVAAGCDADGIPHGFRKVMGDMAAEMGDDELMRASQGSIHDPRHTSKTFSDIHQKFFGAAKKAGHMALAAQGFREAGERRVMRGVDAHGNSICLLYTSPSPRDRQKSRMPSSA